MRAGAEVTGQGLEGSGREKPPGPTDVGLYPKRLKIENTCTRISLLRLICIGVGHPIYADSASSKLIRFADPNITLKTTLHFSAVHVLKLVW